MKLILIIVLFYVSFDGSFALFWACTNDTECTATGSICSLERKLCECENFNEVFSDDLTICLTTSLFGEECNLSSQCNLMPSGAICNSGICGCTDGRTYVHGQCRSLKNLDQSCEEDTDCAFGYDPVSVTCKNNVCVCADEYYRRNGNICRKKSMEINGACVVNADCQELGDSVQCLSLKCKNINKSNDHRTSSRQKSLINVNKKEKLSDNTKTNETQVKIATLPHNLRQIAVQTSIEQPPSQNNVSTLTTLNIFSSQWRSLSRFRYLPPYRFDYDSLSTLDAEGDNTQYGSTCTKNGNTCFGLPHSICTNNICLCQLGYYPKNGKCFAELGEIAESSAECENQFDVATKKCICQSNYFYEPNLRVCKKPIQFHLSCTSDSQCSPFGAANCPSEIPRRCTCAQYAEYDELQQLCLFKSGLGAKCQNNDGCPISNSICSNNVCECETFFFENNGQCFAGVDSTCSSDQDCTIVNSECKSETSDKYDEKTCKCRKGFVHFGDECVKIAVDLEDSCVDNEQCTPLLATCIDKRCQCTEQQHFKYGRCEEKKGLSEPCNRVGECYLPAEKEGIECRNSMCQCKFGYRSDSAKKTCIRIQTSSKNSSGRPSVLKIITFVLIGSAFFITTAALKQAYY